MVTMEVRCCLRCIASFFCAFDDLLALAGRDDADLRLVGVLRVVIGDDILQLALGQILGHGLGQHGLPGTGLTDEHDMALLLGGLLDHLYGRILTDDLVG